MKSKQLFNLLLKQNKTITFAESITGGALAANLVKYPGASKIFKDSVITYNEVSKQTILNVSPDLIKRYGVVSKEVAEAMNEGLKKLTEADIYVSITGNAGPTFQNGTQKKVAYISIDFGYKKQTYMVELPSKSRLKNINKAINFTYKTITDMI